MEDVSRPGSGPAVTRAVPVTGGSPTGAGSVRGPDLLECKGVFGGAKL
jgi:hypothetical protein